MKPKSITDWHTKHVQHRSRRNFISLFIPLIDPLSGTLGRCRCIVHIFVGRILSSIFHVLYRPFWTATSLTDVCCPSTGTLRLSKILSPRTCQTRLGRYVEPVPQPSPQTSFPSMTGFCSPAPEDLSPPKAVSTRISST